MINKSSSETNKIIYNKSFINIKTKKKNISLTGGEAINMLLRKINLQQTCALYYTIY